MEATDQPPNESTRTPEATLLPRDREARLGELLGNNGGCVLPCLWGMVPGATEADSAWKLVLELGAEVIGGAGTDPSVGQGTGFLIIDQANVGINTIERDGVIQSIDLYGENHANPFSLQSDWEIYSLSSVLSAYGVPTRAFLEAVVEAGDDPLTRRYALWLFYDRMGFAVRYGGAATVVDGVVRICPGWAGPGGMDAIRLLLQSPTSPTPLEALTGYTEEQLQFVWPIESASGLTVKEFHDLYMQGDGLECIEMPLGESAE